MSNKYLVNGMYVCLLPLMQRVCIFWVQFAVTKTDLRNSDLCVTLARGVKTKAFLNTTEVHAASLFPGIKLSHSCSVGGIQNKMIPQ